MHMQISNASKEKEVYKAKGQSALLKTDLEEAKDEITKLTSHEIIEAREEIAWLRIQSGRLERA